MVLRLEKGLLNGYVYDESDKLVYTIKPKITLNKHLCIYKGQEMVSEIKQKLFTNMLPIYEMYMGTNHCGSITRELYYPFLDFSIQYNSISMKCNSLDFTLKDTRGNEIGNIYQYSHLPDTLFIQVRDHFELLLVMMSIAIEWGKER